MRFGLDGGGEATLDEAGVELGVTRERIRQIEIKAIRKIRQRNKANRVSGIDDVVTQPWEGI